MKLTLRDNLPFVAVQVAFGGKTVEIAQVLVDTGSATTIFAVDALAHIGVVPLPDDDIHVIQGVGGSEVVFGRRLDFVQVDTHKAINFTVEVGGMDYGFDINGILGMDFLLQTEALLDMKQLELRFGSDDSF